MDRKDWTKEDMRHLKLRNWKATYFLLPCIKHSYSGLWGSVAELALNFNPCIYNSGTNLGKFTKSYVLKNKSGDSWAHSERKWTIYALRSSEFKGKTNKISSESFIRDFPNQTAQRERKRKNTSDLTLERKYSTAVLRVCSDNRLLHPGWDVVTKHVTS